MAGGIKEKPRYGYNFRRTHKETEFDTLWVAVDLKTKVTKYVMSDKYLPKKFRYFDGKPAVAPDINSYSPTLIIRLSSMPRALSVRMTMPRSESAVRLSETK